MRERRCVSDSMAHKTAIFRMLQSKSGAGLTEAVDLRAAISVRSPDNPPCSPCSVHSAQVRDRQPAMHPATGNDANVDQGDNVVVLNDGVAWVSSMGAQGSEAVERGHVRTEGHMSISRSSRTLGAKKLRQIEERESSIERMAYTMSKLHEYLSGRRGALSVIMQR